MILVLLLADPVKQPPPVAPKPSRGMTPPSGGGVTSVYSLLDQLENSVPPSPAHEASYTV